MIKTVPVENILKPNETLPNIFRNKGENISYIIKEYIFAVDIFAVQEEFVQFYNQWRSTEIVFVLIFTAAFSNVFVVYKGVYNGSP